MLGSCELARDDVARAIGGDERGALEGSLIDKS